MKFSKERWAKITEELKYYRLDTVIHFGKYRASAFTLREIIEIDPTYVRYLINECDKLLDDEAYEYLERFEL